MTQSSVLRRSFSSYHHSFYALPAGVTSQLLSPALILYGEKVRNNIACVLAACGSNAARWRPHVKTIKCAALFELLAEAGVRKFKCATPREADSLAACLDRYGGGDVLCAFPHVGPNLTRLDRVASAHPTSRFSVLVETAEDAASVVGSTMLDVFVDVNSGMNRSGAPLGAAASEAALGALAAVGTRRFGGVHLYDGHASAMATVETRVERLFPSYDALLELDAALGGQHELITAGTPAFETSLRHAGLRETGRHTVSPGTVVLSDARAQRQCPTLGLEPAALVFSRVVSHPTKTTFTLDAGVKALAADAGHPMCEILAVGAAVGRRFVPGIPSEEHLPVEVADGGGLPARGEAMYLFPKHVCPTVNLAEMALFVTGGGAVDRPREYSLVPVDARAHDIVLEQGLCAPASRFVLSFDTPKVRRGQADDT